MYVHMTAFNTTRDRISAPYDALSAEQFILAHDSVPACQSRHSNATNSRPHISRRQAAVTPYLPLPTTPRTRRPLCGDRTDSRSDPLQSSRPLCVDGEGERERVRGGRGAVLARAGRRLMSWQSQRPASHRTANHWQASRGPSWSPPDPRLVVDGPRLVPFPSGPCLVASRSPPGSFSAPSGPRLSPPGTRLVPAWSPPGPLLIPPGPLSGPLPVPLLVPCPVRSGPRQGGWAERWAGRPAAGETGTTGAVRWSSPEQT